MKTIRFLLLGVLLGGPASSSGQTPPTITRQPTNQCVSLGTDATLAVRASGSVPLYYQWRCGERELEGATNAALVLAEVQYACAGGYGVAITNAYGSTTSQVAQITVVPGFTRITDRPPVNDLGGPIAAAWGDYDGDGLPDLYVGNSDPTPGSHWLYHNLTNGTFARMDDDVLGTAGGLCWGSAWGDYDNDGNLDLYVCKRVTGPLEPNLLFRNLGGGEFDRITTNGVELTAQYLSLGVTWQDYDNDGYLDWLLMANSRTPGQDYTCKNLLFHGNRDGTFTRITQGPLLAEGLGNPTAAWSDYDNDGLLDLVQAVFSGAQARLKVFHNQGNGAFASVVNALTQSPTEPSGALAWGDYDNDGLPDLFSAGRNDSNLLFHNEGGGVFSRRVLTFAASGYSMNASWGDLDNDGFQDLFLARYGAGVPGSPVTPLVYHNNGDGSFTLVTTGEFVEDGGSSGGGSGSCVWGDYDNDGFLDLAFDQDDHMCLYHNNTNSNHWLKLNLIGTTSNRSAIGAKVRVKATIGGRTCWQLREIIGGRGTAQDDPRPHFGLGDATVAEVIRVEWPSGIVQELRDIPARQILTVKEPVRLEPQAAGSFSWRSWKGMVFDVLSSPDCTSWESVATVTNLTGVMQFTDPNPSNQAARFYRVLNQ